MKIQKMSLGDIQGNEVTPRSDNPFTGVAQVAKQKLRQK